MNTVIPVLGFLGLIGCYDIAHRMSMKTRHGIRVAVIVVGVGCAVAMGGKHDLALLILLTGCGLYRLFDKRASAYDANPGGLRDVATGAIEPMGRTHEPVASTINAMGGGVHLQVVRQNDVRRIA